MQLKQQGAEFQKETSSLLLTWISWQPTLETSFGVGRCCFQREACIRLLMAFIYALLLIEFRFLCFLLLLFCSFLTACFSVKLMNTSVESFSCLMEIVVGGAPCQDQPGYYYLGAKRDLCWRPLVLAQLVPCGILAGREATGGHSAQVTPPES